jgi:DNA polymerase-3 subunit epsilon
VLWSSPRWEDIPFWALDLETGGLDARRDAILAVAMVPIRAGVIRMGEAWESLVRPERAVSAASITAHQLVPTDVRQAPLLDDVLGEVDRRLGEGGALLVHHAPLDVAFLRNAYAAHRRRWPDPPVVDTVRLLWRLKKRRRFVDPDPLADPELNLTVARRQLGLPDYPRHDALTDALAAAELFLVLRQKLGARTLRDLR